LIVLAFNLIQVLTLFAKLAEELGLTLLFLFLVRHLADTPWKKFYYDRPYQSPIALSPSNWRHRATAGLDH
jgi:hypothetical protein